jgi:hypothetical protein
MSTLGLDVFLGMTASTPCFHVLKVIPLLIAMIDISDASIVARYVSCASALHCPKELLSGSAVVCSLAKFLSAHSCGYQLRCFPFELFLQKSALSVCAWGGYVVAIQYSLSCWG